MADAPEVNPETVNSRFVPLVEVTTTLPVFTVGVAHEYDAS